MKKLLLLLIFVGTTFGVVTHKSAKKDGRALLHAVKTNNKQAFTCLVERVVQQYGHEKKKFVSIFDTRDNEQLNVVHYATVIGDLEFLAILLDALQSIFKNDPEGLFGYLDKKAVDGYGIVALAQYNANKRVMEYVLRFLQDNFKNKPDLFLKLVNTMETRFGQRPLGKAAYDGQNANVHMLVNTAKVVLGKTSTNFKTFVDATNRNGKNATQLARSPNDYIFLKKHSEPIGLKSEGDEALAKRAGQELIDATSEQDLELFKARLFGLKKRFNNNRKAILRVLLTPDEAGWSVFSHIAADGLKDFLKPFIRFLDTTFGSSDSGARRLLLREVDIEGRTPLHLAIGQKHFSNALYILEKLKLYTQKNALLFATLNAPDELNGFSPFANALFLSGQFDNIHFDFIQSFTDLVKKVYGQDSRAFYLFVNMKDYNDNTPFSYAANKKLKRFLIDNGAVVSTREKVAANVGNIQGLVK